MCHSDAQSPEGLDRSDRCYLAAQHRCGACLWIHLREAQAQERILRPRLAPKTVPSALESRIYRRTRSSRQVSSLAVSARLASVSAPAILSRISFKKRPRSGCGGWRHLREPGGLIPRRGAVTRRF